MRLLENNTTTKPLTPTRSEQEKSKDARGIKLVQ